MNLFYSVEIDFMKSLSLPVLEQKSSFLQSDPWAFKSLSQKSSKPLLHTQKNFLTPLPKDFPKVRPKKQQVPWTL